MKRAFVIGHPIAHSRSPLIHRSWLRAHGVTGSYDAIDVAPAQLPEHFRRLRQGEFVGGNVTIPLKEAALELCDTVDPLARQIGAANTLVLQGDRIHGSNTDSIGFLHNLDQTVPGWDTGLASAIVLGAGGAARAILVALAQRRVGSIHVLNRDPSRAETLARTLDGPLVPGPLTDFAAHAPTAGLVVNTTSVGLHGTAFSDLPLQHLPLSSIVNDLVYVPLETPLLATARKLGRRCVDGLGMLLHQAVPGFEKWFGVRPAVTPELRHAVAATLEE